ncbi:hypothetical protein CASFOL_015535 [Castilleja foliolosa]|uniref:Thioredoxin domain-containing protein n=1 Tax=Castilleja foliolosa TaxID=1961234 RepID=A0ABD3DFU5_9LAMI
MSCLKTGSCVHWPIENMANNRAKMSFRVCSSIETLQYKESISREILTRNFSISDQKHASNFNIKAPIVELANAQPKVCISRALRWWDKSLQPNMIEIQSAQELVDFLLNAGDRLVILSFYSPGCGGCKTLHPKICQLAEMNPSAIFLKLNYEEHKAMCYALRVHVFVGIMSLISSAEGRLSSFSCTNATIKKFKDALAKHGNDRCSLGQAKGLDESEVLALASIGLISRDLGLSSNKMEVLGLNSNKMEDLGIKETSLYQEAMP